FNELEEMFAFLLYTVLLFNNFSFHEFRRPKVLIIGFDGFRWDYPRYFNTPTLNAIAAKGIHARNGMRASFTTKTLPNFWTLATGLHIESHGIIDMKFFDEKFNETFSFIGKSNRNSKWWVGEPIWVTAKRQGKKVGVYFWAGSDVKLNGILPDFWRRYRSNAKFETRMNTAIDWLDKEDVDLAMVYVNEPDKTAHTYGTFHHKVRQVVEALDSLLRSVVNQLEARNLANVVNLLIVSDHGMTDLKSIRTNKSIINLNEFISVENDLIKMRVGIPAGLFPKPGKLNYVYAKLKNASAHMKVYLKEELPSQLRYQKSSRIAPIVVIPDEGYFIERQKRRSIKGLYIGQHGYDNDLSSMRPIFYAAGFQFKKNLAVDIFNNVDVYPLTCHLLGIKPAPNNGSLASLKNFLSN
ncbi:ectonucleotide pyrophosphatase/phosphodiesterase family member 5-like protein, partial [Dinothrombium tinctorium]